MATDLERHAVFWRDYRRRPGDALSCSGRSRYATLFTQMGRDTCQYAVVAPPKSGLVYGAKSTPSPITMIMRPSPAFMQRPRRCRRPPGAA